MMEGILILSPGLTVYPYGVARRSDLMTANFQHLNLTKLVRALLGRGCLAHALRVYKLGDSVCKEVCS